MPTLEEQEQLFRTIYARLSPEQRTVADDICKRSEDNAVQERSWIAELLFAATEIEKLETQTPWHIIDMFWIRLHGVFKELMGNHRIGYEAVASGQVTRPSLAQYAADIYEKAHAVLSNLEEEEVLIADYYRQRSAHLRQDSYTIRLSKSGVRAQRGVTYIDRTFSVAETDRIRAVMLALFGSEEAIALHLARKSRPAIERLSVAMEALHHLPDFK